MYLLYTVIYSRAESRPLQRPVTPQVPSLPPDEPASMQSAWTTGGTFSVPATQPYASDEGFADQCRVTVGFYGAALIAMPGNLLLAPRIGH